MPPKTFTYLQNQAEPRGTISSAYENAGMAGSSAMINNISQKDTVIAIMGVTGAGKSTFISYFSKNAQVGNGLESFTMSVEAHEAVVDNQRIILVDTPGFDDTHRSEAEVLREVADWLNRSFQQNIKLAGIIYLHRINDNRVGGAALMNLRMFKQLCGEDQLSCVVLATTMWGLVPRATALKREQELKESDEFWAGMIRRKSKVLRQDQEAVSAQMIIRYILSQRHQVTLQIQKEMANGTTLDQTSAGREVNEEINRLREHHEKEMNHLRAQFSEADAEYKKELKAMQAKIEKKMKEEREDKERMKVTMQELQRQRDEELRREREKSHQLELEHQQRIFKSQAELEKIRDRNDMEAQLIKAELQNDLEKAKAQRYREQLRRVQAASCSVM